LQKILSILKIVHTRPDVSPRQLPQFQHTTAIIQTTKLLCVQHAVSTSTPATWRAARAHSVT